MKKKAWIFAGATLVGFLIIAILLDWEFSFAGAPLFDLGQMLRYDEALLTDAAGPFAIPIATRHKPIIAMSRSRPERCWCRR